ncbi:MAG: MATE family efflux transporter [Victivallaceae bacterium]|nr:MATE family efflux transporter [Victivallaceae bacterium]
MNKYEIDMCRGPLAGKILLFAVPLMATYILQLLFNAADLVVIGHFSHHRSLAAIGATMNLNSLAINVFCGLAIGSNIIVARAFGEKRPDLMKKAVPTTMLLALAGGILLMIAGLFAAKPILQWMKTPEEILPLSCIYIRICFCAIPFIMLYNFGCAILRAVGDTRRPLYFLIAAGIVNVGLNLIFVLIFKLDVAGVALATASSHLIAASLICRTLLKCRENYALSLKHLVFDRKIFTEILQLGVPAAVQSSGFALSNIIIQSAINTFGPAAIAGTTAALGLEGFVYVGSFSYHQTALSFVAQNLGGGKFKRILSSLGWCYLWGVLSCGVIGIGCYLAGESLLGAFSNDPEVIAWGFLRMKMLFVAYMLCPLMDVSSGGLRSLGYSLTAMTVTLIGACGFRIWYVKVILPRRPTMETLLVSYPVSWALVAVVSFAILLYAYRKLLCRRCGIATPWLLLQPGVTRGMRYLVNPK